MFFVLFALIRQFAQRVSCQFMFKHQSDCVEATNDFAFIIFCYSIVYFYPPVASIFWLLCKIQKGVLYMRRDIAEWK